MPAPSSDRAGIRQTIRALRRAGCTITGGHEPVIGPMTDGWWS